VSRRVRSASSSVAAVNIEWGCSRPRSRRLRRASLGETRRMVFTARRGPGGPTRRGIRRGRGSRTAPRGYARRAERGAHPRYRDRSPGPGRCRAAGWSRTDRRRWPAGRRGYRGRYPPPPRRASSRYLPTDRPRARSTPRPVPSPGWHLSTGSRKAAATETRCRAPACAPRRRPAAGGSGGPPIWARSVSSVWRRGAETSPVSVG